MGQIKCDEWNSNIKFHGSLFPNLSQGHSKCTIEKLHSNAIFRLIFIESIHRLWPNCMNHVFIIYNRNKKQRINKESIMARKKKNSTNTTQATRPIKIAFHYYGIYFENSTLHIPQRIWWWRGSLNCLFNSFSCLCVCFVCVFFLLVFVSSVFFFFWHPIGYTILEFESMKRKKNKLIEIAVKILFGKIEHRFWSIWKDDDKQQWTKKRSNKYYDIACYGF